MLTSEEMGKRLYDLMKIEGGGVGAHSEAVWERDPDTRNFYRAVAIEFADWLNAERTKRIQALLDEQPRYVLPLGNTDHTEQPSGYQGMSATTKAAIDRYRYPRLPLLRCREGHILSHPEDIERRYCGRCREFLP